MRLVFDAGGLVALERNDRQVWRRLVDAAAAGLPSLTHGGVVAQVWRGGSGRQASLSRALAGIEVLPLDDALGRAAGLLLAKAGTSDAIDAAVVALARNGDLVVTSDAYDIDRLVLATGRRIDVVPV